MQPVQTEHGRDHLTSLHLLLHVVKGSPSHLPHVHNGSGAVLQRLGKLKARGHLALAKLDVQPDVKPAIFCYLDLCFNHKTTTLSP